MKTGTKVRTASHERGEHTKCVYVGEYDVTSPGRIGDNGDLDNRSVISHGRDLTNGNNALKRRDVVHDKSAKVVKWALD